MSRTTAATSKRAEEVTHWVQESDFLVAVFGITGACAAIEAAESPMDPNLLAVSPISPLGSVS